jgi:hypothetical protein
MGLTSTVVRVRRLSRLFHDVQEQTGSSFAAFGYVSRMVVRKLPTAFRQLRSMTRYRTEVKRIADIKTHRTDQRPFIGFKVTGGLGDYLVIARFIRDLSAHVGGFDFDVYTTRPGPAQWIFGAVDGLRGSHNDLLFDFTLSAYDLAARVNQFVTFHDKVAQWASLRSRPNLVRAVNKAVQFRPRIEPFIQNHPYMDGYLAQKAVYSNCTRADFIHHIADIPYGGDQLDLELATGVGEQHGLTPGRYITIHNGFDPEFFTASGQATKCYPYFDSVIALVKSKWPDLKFVQVGVGTSNPLANVDVNLVDQTSIKEAGALIGHALLHVDNEGGLVHLARCLGVDSCVVFGPTPSNYFGYSGNINIDPTFCGGCWWNNETWMDRCPRGFEDARCMTEQDPRSVAIAIDRRLSAKLSPQGAGQGRIRQVAPLAGMPMVGHGFAASPE